MNVAPYPNREIVLAAPFPPGHVSDLQARVLAPHVGRALRQPVTVVNWPGASGTLALEQLKQAAPDGYTLLMHGFGGLAVTPHLMKVSYDPTADFAPIIRLVTAPLVLVVGASLPVGSVGELVTFARDDPGRVRGGSFGVGSNSHLAFILFNRRAGLAIPHAAYPGGFDTTGGLVAGAFDLMFEFPAVVLPHIRAGRLRPLAVTARRRSAALPDVPTLEEAGLPGADITGWQGILGPRGVPPEIMARLNGAFADAQALPEVRRRLEAEGYHIEGGTPDAFAAFIRAEYERWGKFIREEGIRPEAG
jgi:tripartite-type tricarboxylate transporter receptor subunit TctC